MSITSEADWRGLRDVGHIVHLTLERLAAAVRPGVTTRELDAVAARVFAAHGAQSAPALTYGFPGTVLISVNDEIVHGVPGARRLERGDLVKLDVTVEKDGYVADAARTVIVGFGSPVAEQLRACASSALRAALQVARAGTMVNEIGRAVTREVRKHGFSVVRGLTGHGVGRTIHEQPEVPNEYNPRQRDVLTAGLVLTIEPLISAGSPHTRQDADGWTIRTRDGSLSAHSEHTIVITSAAPLVLAS
jgi:methionyl aminopeptidase